MSYRDKIDGPRGTMIAIMVAITVAAVLLINAILGYAWALQQRTMRQSAEAHATQLARALDTYTRLLQQYAAATAANDTAISALREPGNRTNPGFPGLSSSTLIPLGPLGIADPAFTPASLRNNIEINLVGAAFNDGQVRVEANVLDGNWVLSAAARVASSGDGNQVLLLRSELAPLLENQLSGSLDPDQYSLWFVGSHNEPVAIGPGSGAGDTIYRVASPLRGVYAGYSPSQRFLQESSISGISLLGATIGGTLLLLGLVAFAFRQLRNQLLQDANRLEDLALRQRSSTATLPTLHYGALQPLAESLLKMRRQTKPVQEAPVAEATEAAEEHKFMDPLEIEMLEEDATDGVQFETEPSLVIPAEIFRDYDIRGRTELISVELAHALGQAIGSEAQAREVRAVVVGADGRESSPALREHLVRGLLGSGIDVIDLGTVATPMLYFACNHLQTMSGVMVTGSHNAADHNGFKIMLAGETLCGDQIQALRQRVIAQDFREGQGSYRVTEIDADYSRAVTEDVLVDAPLKLVIDCGNGAASVIAVELFQELGCDVLPLFCELDGRFPNHAPDPSVPENLRHLLAEVAAQGADLGIAFDGDGDRIGVVSASGSVVMADRLLMLFARDLLSRNPGADVVFDVKCSRDLSAVVVHNGGRPIMCRSGHSWIKQKMRESGALLGGEFTGHICFKDRWFGFDDALYAGARLLEILTSSGHTLDELLADLPHSVGTAELRIELPEEQKFAAIHTVCESIELENARLMKLDGVRAEYADGWGLVRASNTSAALICRFEAQDQSALDRIKSAFASELGRLLPGVTIPF